MEPSDQSVPLGGSVTLQCIAKGFPSPKINWRRETGKQCCTYLTQSLRGIEKVVMQY